MPLNPNSLTIVQKQPFGFVCRACMCLYGCRGDGNELTEGRMIVTKSGLACVYYVWLFRFIELY